MSNEVFANGNEIACKSGDGKVIAAFPDVCLSPPSPPAGPVPVPYPDTSFSKDMQNGSKTVQIDGKEVMLKDKSFYKTSPLGDEAATNTLGQGVITHVITGKTYFVAWSMDVMIEGENVDRHIDLTTSNHASQPGNENVPIPNQEEMALADSLGPICECCKGSPHSRSQREGKTMTEEEFYMPVMDKKGTRPGFAKDAEALLDLVRNSGNPSGKCKGLLPPSPSGDDPCNKYYFSSAKESQSARNLFEANKTGGEKIAHRVPLAAGGCPVGPGNQQPVTDPQCLYLEDELGKLQGRAAEYHRNAIRAPYS